MTKQAETMWYFEMFHINPIRVTITYFPSPDDENSPLKNLLGSVLHATIPTIESAPLHLNALIMKQLFSTKNQIIEKLGKHYKNQAIRRVCVSFFLLTI
jgi:hypothetical protein